jgi:predicted DCC family thiol-disulfide oxidoreductase YuxK
MFAQMGRATEFNASSNPSAGWVFYDNACGFCRRFARKFERALAARGYGLCPLQSALARGSFRLSPEELASDIRLLRSDGMRLAGSEVYRYLFKRIWWTWPLGVLGSLPVLNQVFDAGYRLVARHRSWVGAATGHRC